MQSFSIGRLAVVLVTAGAMLVAVSAGGQQKQAVGAQQKKAAATQKKSVAAGQQRQPAEKAHAPIAVHEIVPKNVLGFGVVRNLGELDEKIAALAKDLQLPAPGALMMIRTLSGIQEGLDEKGPVVVAVLPGKEEGDMPVTVLFAPVSDYKKFVAQLRPADADAEQTEVSIAGQDFVVMKKGAFAALAAPRDADRLKEIVAAQAGSLGIPGHLTAWAGDHDAYLVVMPEAIKRAIGPIREGLQQAKGAFPADNDQFKFIASTFELYDKLLSTIQTEVTHFGLGLRIDAGTIYINSQSAFLPNGSLAQAAKDASRPAESALAALPAGPYMMAFDGVVPESWFKGMAKFSAEAMRMMVPAGGEKLTDEQIRQLTETMQQSMAGIRSMAFRVGTLEHGKSMYANTSGVMKVENSREFLANYEKSIRAMAKAFEDSDHPLFKSYKVSKGKVGDVETLELAMDMSAMMKAGGDPNAQQMMEKMVELMVGEGGKITAYLAASDANTVVIAYGEETLNQTLQSAKMNGNSFTAQADVVKTMQLLPKDAQWVALVSPNGILSSTQSMMRSFAPGQPQLPPMPELPPFALGARMTTEGCETSLVLPKDVLVGISQYAQKVQQNFQPGQQPGVNGVPPRELKR